MPTDACIPLDADAPDLAFECTVGACVPFAGGRCDVVNEYRAPQDGPVRRAGTAIADAIEVRHLSREPFIALVETIDRHAGDAIGRLGLT